jgi:VanZ family protein
VKELMALPTLHELNLSGTFAGSRSASLLAAMPALRRVNLADTFVSGWGRFQLRRRRPDLEVLTRRDGDHRPSTSQRVYRWVFRLLVLYVIGLVIATHMPEEPEVIRRVNWPGSDKAAHFSIYGGLTFLLALLITVRSRHRRLRTGLSATAYAGIAIFVATFGAIDEITQPWTGRDRDFWDWVADVSGMASGLIVFSLIQLYRRRGRNPALAQSVTPVPITSKPAQVP